MSSEPTPAPQPKPAPAATPAPAPKAEAPKQAAAPAAPAAAAEAPVTPPAPAPAQPPATPPDLLAEFFQRFRKRFEDTDPADIHKAGPLAKAWADQRIFGVLDQRTQPPQIRIGVQSGAHTYVVVRLVRNIPTAQLYSAIPAAFNNLIVPQIKEVGGMISATPFIKPSGLQG